MLARLLALALLCASCTSLSPAAYTRLEDHVLSFDAFGHLVELESRSRMTADERQARYQRIFDKARQSCTSFCSASSSHEHVDDSGGERVRKILLHVHGGMKSPKSTMKQVDRTLDALALDEARGSEDWHYPIFVQWPSGPFSTYRDHLVHIRQGRWTPVYGPLTIPFVLPVDLARGLARFPRSAPYQYGLDLGVAGAVGSQKTYLTSWRNAEDIYAALRSEGSFDVRRGEYRRGSLTQARRFVVYWLTQPVKLFVQTFVLDGMGQGAWDTMLWRTRSLFWRPETFAVGEQESPCERSIDAHAMELALGEGPNGHLAEFLRTFRVWLDEERAAGRRYEITLVGHSMGAIVLNDALSWGDDLGPDRGEPLDVSFFDPEDIGNIVYMAPACSILDAAQAVVPFLRQNSELKFRVLTLHPIAEADEINGFDLPPRGSLLEWIDNWYTVPSSHADRRLGKWVNVLQALPMFAGVREQFSVKGFAVDEDTIPQKHGDFNRCPFWRETFWCTEGPYSYEADWAKQAPPSSS